MPETLVHATAESGNDQAAPRPEDVPNAPETLNWYEIPHTIEVYEQTGTDSDGNEVNPTAIAFHVPTELPEWSDMPWTSNPDERRIIMHGEDGTTVSIDGSTVSSWKPNPDTSEFDFEQIELQDGDILPRIDGSEAWKVEDGTGRSIELNGAVLGVRIDGGEVKSSTIESTAEENPQLREVPIESPFEVFRRRTTISENDAINKALEDLVQEDPTLVMDQPESKQKGFRVPSSYEEIRDWKEDFNRRYAERPDPLPQRNPPEKPLTIAEQYAPGRAHFEAAGKELYNKFDKEDAKGRKYWDRVDQRNAQAREAYLADKPIQRFFDDSDKFLRDIDAKFAAKRTARNEKRAAKKEAKAADSPDTANDPNAAPDAGSAEKGSLAKAREKAGGVAEWLKRRKAAARIGNLSLRREAPAPSETWDWELEHGNVVRYGAVEGDGSVKSMIEFTDPGTKFLWSADKPKRRGTVVMETEDGGKVVLKGKNVYAWKFDGTEFKHERYTLGEDEVMPSAFIGEEWSLSALETDLGKVNKVYMKYRKLTGEQAAENGVDVDPEHKPINPFGGIEAMIKRLDEIEAARLAEQAAQAADADTDS